MKKLIILTSVVVLAGFANAASVQWNSGLFTEGFVGPDGNSLKNSTAYTMVVSFYSDSKGNTTLTTSQQTKAKPNGAYNNTTADVFNSGVTYYVSAILSATDGSSSLKSGIASFTMPDTGNGNLNFQSGSGFDTTSKKWASGGWESQSVPEPTSALLMLFGFAGLALKRKNA